MEFLSGRYGPAFMTALHNEDENGLDGLQIVLDRYLTGKTVREVIHDWAAMVAVDRAIDGGAKVHGAGRAADFQTPTLNAAIYWENPEAYSTPGAPPNGSDYVRLRDSSGAAISAKRLRSLEFVGAAKHVAPPLEWESVTVGGDAVLSAGAEHDADRSIVRSIDVPATGDASLTFETQYGIETGWDFGFVQISTDDGLTWTSQGNAHTTSEHDPGALGTHVAQLPGFSGNSPWGVETFDLSAYAGQTALLRFRMMTDEASLGNGAGIEAGWLVDEVRVGGVLVSDGTLAGWGTEAPPIVGFTVQLIGLDAKDGREVVIATLPLRDGHTVLLTGGRLNRLVGERAGEVGAIVTYDERSESIRAYAPYVLKANGVTQPGG